MTPHDDELAFEIRHVLEQRGTVRVLTRALNPELPWSLRATSTLGGVPIDDHVVRPLAFDRARQLRRDLFGFTLRVAEDRGRLHRGDIVLLQP